MHVLTRWPTSPRVRWNADRTGGFLPGLGQFRLAAGVAPEVDEDGRQIRSPAIDLADMADKSLPRPRWIATEQLTRDTLALVPRLPDDLTAVVGVARSGMLPATIVATALHLPLYVLDQERRLVRDAGHGWRLGRSDSREGAKVLVVDDTTGSGRSLRMTEQALAQCAGCRFARSAVTTCSVYCNPESQRKPDLWGVDLHLPHLLEWNFANSIVASASAFDMDGIVCHDAESGGAPGTPLWLPRREPARIITGRSERHREATLRWLRRWGVEVASLTMKPDGDERPFAEYKAEAVREFAATAHERPYGPPIYFESCPRQAERIAELSGVMTVCPIAGAVFGPEGCWQ